MCWVVTKASRSACVVHVLPAHCTHQQTRNIDTMLVQCWASVVDGGSAFIQHWVNVFLMVLSLEISAASGLSANVMNILVSNVGLTLTIVFCLWCCRRTILLDSGIPLGTIVFVNIPLISDVNKKDITLLAITKSAFDVHRHSACSGSLL